VLKCAEDFLFVGIKVAYNSIHRMGVGFQDVSVYLLFIISIFGAMELSALSIDQVCKLYSTVCSILSPRLLACCTFCVGFLCQNNISLLLL